MKQNPVNVFVKLALVMLTLGVNMSVYAQQKIKLGGVDYVADTLAWYPCGPSSEYMAVRFELPGGSVKGIDMFLMRVDTRDSLISLQQVLGKGKVVGNETVSGMGTRMNKVDPKRVFFGGTNGDFFVTSGDVGRPVGMAIVNQEMAFIPDNQADRRVGAIDEQMKGAISTIAKWTGYAIVKGDTLEMSRVNYKRNADNLVLYNGHNGATTGTNAYGTELLLEPLEGEVWHTTGEVKAVVKAVEKNKGSMSIGAGQVVLSGHGTMAAALDTAAIGDTIVVGMTLTLDDKAMCISQSIAGDNYALIANNGKAETSNFWNELHPRTAFGQSMSGDTLFLMVVDGRRPTSGGCTTRVLGELMCHYGAWKAVNWDGGGSSHLWLQNVGLMNYGCETTERAVGNGMFVVANVPEVDTVVTRLEATAKPLRMPRYGVIRPQVMGYNRYGLLVKKDIQDYTMSCDSLVGEIDENGAFMCKTSGKVHLEWGTAQGDMEVRMEMSAPISFPVKKVLVDDVHSYLPHLDATLSARTMSLAPQAVEWTIADGDIAEQQADYSIIGKSNGSTWLYARVGENVDSMEVLVEIANAPMVKQDSMNAPATWTVSNSSKAMNAKLQSGEDGQMVVECAFSGSRNQQLKLEKDIRMYGLPKSMKIGWSSDGLVCSAVRCFITQNGSTAAKQIKINDVTDSTLVLDLPSAFAEVGDITFYPLTFEGLTFVLDGSTPKKTYHLRFSGLWLEYEGVETRLEDVTKVIDDAGSKRLKDGRLVICKDGRVYDAEGREL